MTLSLEIRHPSQEFIDGLRARLGASHVRTGSEIQDLDPGTTPDNLGAAAVVFPGSTKEVADVVRLCAEAGISVVTQGGRTGLVGGSTTGPHQIALSTTRLGGIETIDPNERVAVVGAGVSLQALQEAAGEHGLEPGIDLAARGSATIGGMIATNAGGVMAFRNGVMRHRVLGIEAVTADGTIYSDMTRVMKNAAGYDLKHLFIGSEGTLGIVTKAAIALVPRPKAEVTAIFGLPSVASALEAVRLALDIDRGHLRAAEILWNRYIGLTASDQDWNVPELPLDQPIYLIVCLGGSEEDALREALAGLFGDLVERHPTASGIIASSKRQEAEIWRLRENTDLLYRRHPNAPSYDVSVPLPLIEKYAERVRRELADIDADLDPYMFGHLADGNLHIVLNREGPLKSDLRDRIEAVLYRDLKGIGGSFSAEHGVGSKRIHALALTADEGKLSSMRTLKAALDPRGILNPGKVLPVLST